MIGTFIDNSEGEISVRIFRILLKVKTSGLFRIIVMKNKVDWRENHSFFFKKKVVYSEFIGPMTNIFRKSASKLDYW